MKKTVIPLSLFVLFITLTAHEFWLSPDKFIYNRGDNINIRFLVGENFEGDNWSGNHSRIQTLKLFFGGVSDDLSGYLTAAPGDSVELSMLDEGTAMIAFNSNNAFLELDPVSFQEYLQQDGLNEALELRRQLNETDSAGREYYQRCAKTIFQVGKIKDKTSQILTHLPVDLVPQVNPYSLKNQDTIRVKIFYFDQPLPGTLIKVWHRTQDSTVSHQLISDESGEIEFPVNTTGQWMISLVKMIRLHNDPKAQWQSYWGSLTWGYE